MKLENGRRTTIIVDGSFHSRRILSIVRKDKFDADEGYREWRYRYLDGIINYVRNFDAREVIIACDARKNWRKEIYPLYKAMRKITRDRDEEKHKDWVKYDEYYQHYDNLMEEIRENLPFKVMMVERCEADDIAGILCSYEGLQENNKIVITNDSDYVQLLSLPNTYVYNPLTKQYVESNDPRKELIMKVCLGDDGDYIPSIKNHEIYKPEFLEYCVKREVATTPELAQIVLDNDEEKLYYLVIDFVKEFGFKPMRSMKISSKKINDLLATDKLQEFLNEEENKMIKMKYERNYKLINLTEQPGDVRERIIDEYQKKHNLPDISGLFGYFVEKRYRGFLNDINKIQSSLELLY